MALTEIAHQAWKAYLHPESWALDATAGNGLDTVFLGKAIGQKGRVFAIDIQASAIASAKEAIARAGIADRIQLRKGDHSQLRQVFPELSDGQLDLISFNLGYLPGGNHAITTSKTTTLRALETSLELLHRGGSLSVIAYRGHHGAMEEFEAVDKWISTLPAPWRCEREVATGSPARPGPVWWMVAQSS